MKRLGALVGMVVALALAAPAYGIGGDFVEDNEHPFVGLVVFYDADGEFVWRCTGSLLTPTVFLTAGHCADTVGGAVTARVYFQQDAGVNYDPATEVDPVTRLPRVLRPGDSGRHVRDVRPAVQLRLPGQPAGSRTHMTSAW